MNKCYYTIQGEIKCNKTIEKFYEDKQPPLKKIEISEPTIIVPILSKQNYSYL